MCTAGIRVSARKGETLIYCEGLMKKTVYKGLSRVKGTKQDGEDLVSNPVQEPAVTTLSLKGQGQGTVQGTS